MIYKPKKVISPGTRVRLAHRPHSLDRRYWPPRGATGTVVNPAPDAPIAGTAVVRWDKPGDRVPAIICNMTWLEVIE